VDEQLGERGAPNMVPVADKAIDILAMMTLAASFVFPQKAIVGQR